jgi:hypothetical protein
VVVVPRMKNGSLTATMMRLPPVSFSKACEKLLSTPRVYQRQDSDPP